MRLADGAEQLAAHVRFAGLAVAHDALAGADDGDAHAVEHVGQALDAAVHAAAGLALAVDGVDHLAARVRVLELDPDLALALVVDHIVLLDVALVLENLRDARADLALGDLDEPTAHPVGVTDAGQHVGDGVLV